jgi:hypothetical protein
MKLNKSEDPLPSEFKKVSISSGLKEMKIWVGVSIVLIVVLYVILKSSGVQL